MRRRTTYSRKSKAPLEQHTSNSMKLSALNMWAAGWFQEGEMSRHSPASIDNRRYIIEKLTWFHNERGFDEINTESLKQFLHHAGKTLEPGVPRWGNKVGPATVKPGTLSSYHRLLASFFSWVVAQDGLTTSPMEKVTKIVDRPDQITPFTPDQQQALRAAAKVSPCPLRNEAIVLLLLDTGIRVSELISLKMKNLDMMSKSLRVEGKGGKERTIYFCHEVSKALWNYLRGTDADVSDPSSPVFTSEGGNTSGEPLTRSGVQQIIRKIGVEAGIKGVRCSPHTFRHTFAITFLSGHRGVGGNQFSLMHLLGHQDVKMTARYVNIARANVEAQARAFSPVEMLSSKTKK